jgi:hypothetical protein
VGEIDLEGRIANLLQEEESPSEDENEDDIICEGEDERGCLVYELSEI